MAHENLIDIGYSLYNEFWRSGYYKLYNSKEAKNYTEAIQTCYDDGTSLILPKSGISHIEFILIENRIITF